MLRIANWLHVHVKDLVDVMSGVVVFGVVVRWLPSIAAVLTILWTMLRIYDWIERRLARWQKSRRKNHEAQD